MFVYVSMAAETYLLGMAGNQVEEKLEEFDATRSSGHLCAATSGTFEQVGLTFPHVLSLNNIKCSSQGVKRARNCCAE